MHRRSIRDQGNAENRKRARLVSDFRSSPYFLCFDARGIREPTHSTRHDGFRTPRGKVFQNCASLVSRDTETGRLSDWHIGSRPLLVKDPRKKKRIFGNNTRSAKILYIFHRVDALTFIYTGKWTFFTAWSFI